MADRQRFLEARPANFTLALVGPYLVWSAHFLAVYIATAMVCAGRIEWTPDGLRAFVLVATAAASLGIVVSPLLAWRRSGGFALALIISAGVALLGLALVAAPAFFISACA